MDDRPPAERLVLQVGDTAGVALALSAALRDATNWAVDEIPLPQPSGSGLAARALGWPSRALAARRVVSEAVARLRPDVVHLHWARFAPFITAGDTPLVVHAHGSDVRGRDRSPMGRVVAAALRRADRVLVSTPDLLAHVPSNALYLPNPIDVDLFAPAPPNDARGDAPPLVLVFAQLTGTKGASVIIEAARRIRSDAPATQIVAFAGGAHDDDARAAGIDLLERRSRADLARFITTADVVIGQQRLGALGLSELEAMATGKPVLMRLDRDLYCHDVPVIAVSDADELAQRCVELLDDRAASAALGARARDYVVQYHSPSVVAGQLGEMYEALR